MPRVGHNPARFVEKVAQPASITVTVVNCIPFLAGYYEQSLDVLKAVIESLNATREPEHPYDVMVFDNHSCAEVRDYLKQAADEGKIQYLVLSDTNIGKIGAWNFLFGAAPGEYIVFADGDVLFRPGWLSASLALFEAFPNVGMVTARPLPTPMEYSGVTLEWARRSQVMEEGRFLDWETFWEHTGSLGVSETEARKMYEAMTMYRLRQGELTAFVGAAHFQFMARREVLQKIIPLPSEQPMRGERTLDIRINEMGLLRLTTEKPLVVHLGNRLGADLAPAPAPARRSLLKRLLYLPGIRHFLLWLHNRIFRLYFSNVE
jgi:GT2 family glycosyltransferase